MMPAGDQELESAQRLNRVSIKFPPFWKSDPELWFMQIEAQFQIAKVTTDETKFFHVVGSVDSEVLTQVADLVKTPPPNDKYATLRKRLIEQFGQSADEKLSRLLQGFELGDRKPSQLLREMRTIASGTTLDDSVLRNLLLKSLPPHAQTILAASKETLEGLTLAADKILAVPMLPSQNVVSQAASADLQVQSQNLPQELNRSIRARGAVVLDSPPSRDEPHHNSSAGIIQCLERGRASVKPPVAIAREMDRAAACRGQCYRNSSS